VFELFVQQNSELSYPDWVDFYQETRDAEKELTGATNLLRKYMTRLRDTVMEFSKMNCVGNGRRTWCIEGRSKDSLVNGKSQIIFVGSTDSIAG